MISLTNINKYYGQLHVLKDVNLEIPDGEIVTILGQSGAGKTTLLQVMGTLDYPDSGLVEYSFQEDISPVRVDNLSSKMMSQFRNRNIGFIFQFHELLPEFTALENVMLPALIGGKGKRESSERAAMLLEKLGLGGRIQHHPSQLSGGEKQRVAVARSLMNDPKVVFADEPTGSLDSRNREDIQSLFVDLCGELHKTFVVVTHDASFCDISHRVVNMQDGRIISIESR